MRCEKYFTIYGRGDNAPSSAAKANWNDLVVITLSEFGRTRFETAHAGTDHAEAGVMFAAGGGVNGYNKGHPPLRRVYGCNTTMFLTGSPSHGWPGPGGFHVWGQRQRYLKRAVDYRSVSAN